MAFSFGSTASSTGQSFGAPAVAPTTSLSLGGGGASTAPAGGGFSFGSTSTSTAAPAFGLGTAVATSAPAFGGFGTPTATVTPLGGGFGAGTTATTSAVAPPLTGFGGFGGATSSAPPPAFGSTTSTTPALSGFGTSAASSLAAPAFGGFGLTSTAPTTTATGTVLSGFGTTVPTPGLSAASTTGTATVGLGGSMQAPAFGLGGLAQPVSQASTGADNKAENKSAKENLIPAELGSTVEELKKFIKEEKGISSDISHVSEKQYSKIREETEALSQLVNVLATGIQKNRVALDRLKLDSAQELMNVETAQHTKDTPPSMQYENVAPMEYFNNLVANFEMQMADYRKQIDQTERHLQVMSDGTAISSEDIVAALQKLHNAFTELAGRYHGIHQALAAYREQYVAIHRRVHGTNGAAVFQTRQPPPVKSGISLPKLSGPSPFSAPGDPLVQARASLPNRTQQGVAGQAGPPTLSLNPPGNPTGTFGSFSAGHLSGGGLFGSTASTNPFGAIAGTVPSPFSGGGSTTTTTSPGLFGTTATGNTSTSLFGSGGGFVAGGSTLFGGGQSSLASPSTDVTGRGVKTPLGGFGASNTTTTSFGSPAFESTAASYDSPSVGNKRNKH